jgi:hypothetical protein
MFTFVVQLTNFAGIARHSVGLFLCPLQKETGVVPPRRFGCNGLVTPAKA